MEIPTELKGKDINLTHLGVNEVAWQRSDAIQLLDSFMSKSVFVLGGDVLSNQNDNYKHNYDNWYFEKEHGDEKESILKAKEYISNYPEGDYVFVIVTEKNS